MFVSVVISLALMLPFFAWGIYVLRVQFIYHEEFAPKVEALTLAGVVAFLVIEASLLRVWMVDMPVLYMMAVLGLVVATAALYGSMMVALASHVMVDMVLPNEHHDPGTPHYAPAEALERLDDYEGALNEYLVISRIFPKDGPTALRIANCLLRLDRTDEAVRAFERGLSMLSDPEQGLRVTNRLAEIYQRKLHQPDDAIRVLEGYMAKYPNSERIESVRRRLSALRN